MYRLNPKYLLRKNLIFQIRGIASSTCRPGWFNVQRNDLDERLEFYREENTRLINAKGAACEPLDLDDWRRQRMSRIAQLESLNAELERMLADLEEERRKHQEEVKFRAKYHGRCAPILL